VTEKPSSGGFICLVSGEGLVAKDSMEKVYVRRITGEAGSQEAGVVMLTDKPS
jgi:hypothetical protein